MGQKNPVGRLIPALALFALACAGPAGHAVQYSVASDDAREFDAAIARPIAYRPPRGRIIGGIVSHHLLAGRHIAGFFSALRASIPASGPAPAFIIIGPNHRSRGGHLVSLSRRPWKTPYGVLAPHPSLATAIANATGAGIDEDAFYNEHAIGALAPFVQHYFPDASMVPVLINYRLAWEDARALGARIAAVARENVIVILSADFTHDKSDRHARENDMRFRELLRRFPAAGPEDIARIELDCRKGLYTMAAFLEARGRSTPHLLGSATSRDIAGPRVPMTSYSFVLFGE
ncbi:MAG TPA: AmmeMemoRadiSam system protein B [Spirochaetota bacterium]|nr:AmmeMemoRadiSam system protein B [Spirochaetota bacterium]HOS39917.1 AmmeMemoRadiSam system protein B [Spirochaetota bacterium]HPI23512.1 AmmeMemoRadiSam system protein B [Spirochaetota bacterium]HPU87742.1 AmmeMemoRadiSam system protein B [Spirochaetota bacterium]